MRGFSAVWEPPSEPDAPVLLVLHGTGGDEHDLLPLGRALAPGGGLLAPRGPVVEGDGIPRFFTRIPTGGGGPYPFTFDDAEIAERAAELTDAVTAHLDAEGCPERSVIGVGFSNGANMVGALMLLQSHLLRAGALFSPMPVLSEPPSPELDEVAAWLGTGRRDPIATPDLTEQLAATLADRGAAVEVAIHDGGHEVPRQAIDGAGAWLAKVRSAIGGADRPPP